VEQRVGDLSVVDTIEEAERAVARAMLAIGGVVDRGGDPTDRPAVAMGGERA
jgi:hypothetical protein